MRYENVVFKPFDKQKTLLKAHARRKGAFSGKRGGKTEYGAIQSILYQEKKPNAKYFFPHTVDPYLGVIIAPTFDMLRRLSLKKFLAYAEPLILDHNKSTHEILWHDRTQIYGLSAEKPERIEGVKAAWIWIDEVFQVSEQLYLECLARVADSKGYLICTGSLGIQYINPKQHWAYKYFKEVLDSETLAVEWSTAENPHFPKEELDLLKENLSPQDFRAMFEINWDTVPQYAVYPDFSEAHIQEHIAYNPMLPTYVSIDWGYAHPMAVGFFQVDESTDTVYMIDEIVQSKLDLTTLYARIMAKPYNIQGYCCDISGTQERELTGRSNVSFFEDRGISFEYRTSSIAQGLALVRSYMKNAKGQIKFYVSRRCEKTIDGIKRYRYPDKNGVIVNEKPVKLDDDACDMLRYFFINFMDKSRAATQIFIERLR